MHEVRQQEVHGSQAQDGEGVGREHDERLTGDGEDRGDGVDGEHHIGGLDQHQHRQQGRGEEHSALADQQALAVVRVCHRHEAAEEPQHGRLLGVQVLVALTDHPPTRVEQERGEHVQDPGEVLDQHRADGDERAPQDQRAQHAEEQDAVLELWRNREVAEDDRPDEHVVDGQGLLDEVAGEVLLPDLGPLPRPEQRSEADAQRHPDGAPGRGLADLDHVGVAVGDEVDGEHGEDDGDDADPHPE